MSSSAADDLDSDDPGFIVIRLMDGTRLTLDPEDADLFMEARDRQELAKREMDSIVDKAIFLTSLMVSPSAEERPLSGGGSIFGDPPPPMDREIDYTILEQVRDRHRASLDGSHDA